MVKYKKVPKSTAKWTKIGNEICLKCQLNFLVKVVIIKL